MLGLFYCFVFGIFIAAYQQRLTSNGPLFAHSDQFLQRASLDRFSIWPLSWNRLPWFVSISPLLLAGLIWGGVQKQLNGKYLLVSLLFFLLSLGPDLGNSIPNPVYLALNSVPSFWRFAKPEAFFFVSFVGILSILIHIKSNRMTLAVVGILISIQWFSIIRKQKEYPSYMSVPIETTLPKNWERRIFAPSE